MRKFDEKLNQVTVFLACMAFAGMIIITSFNVICRYVISKSFAWSEELTYLCFNWAVFMGITDVYRHQGLISIDSLVRKLSPKVQRTMKIITFGVVAILNVALTVWGMQLTIGGWQRTTSALGIPYTFIDLSLPLGTAIMCYYAIEFILWEIQGEHVAAADLQDRV